VRIMPRPWQAPFRDYSGGFVHNVHRMTEPLRGRVLLLEIRKRRRFWKSATGTLRTFRHVRFSTDSEPHSRHPGRSEKCQARTVFPLKASTGKHV
jgi:hypothetical protein